MPSVKDKRVLLLGAESQLGRTVAAALASAGARLALVAATPEPEAAFAVQRLARRLGAVAQAIDATNEMGMRVMVRQIAKQLGGLDAAVFCADRTRDFQQALALCVRFAGKELARGGRTFVALDVEPREMPSAEARPGVTYISFPLQDMPVEQAMDWTLHAVAAGADTR